MILDQAHPTAILYRQKKFMIDHVIDRICNHRGGARMIEAALVLVCKRPASGMGKQRLAASMGREAANCVAEALLACSLEDVQDWPGPVVIAPSHTADYVWAGRLLPYKRQKVCVQPQTDGNLGQRLNALDTVLRDGGLEQLIYIGSDAPALAAADYTEARKALLEYDVVLKRAVDGGVVLMGNRRPWPSLSALPWSTADLGSTLADCCRAAGQSVAILSEGFDVDRQDDVVHLITALKTDQRPARRALHLLASDLVKSTESIDSIDQKEESHVQF